MFTGTGFAGDSDGATDVFRWSNGTITHESIGPTGGNGGVAADYAGLSRDGDHGGLALRLKSYPAGPLPPRRAAGSRWTSEGLRRIVMENGIASRTTSAPTRNAAP